MLRVLCLAIAAAAGLSAAVPAAAAATPSLAAGPTLAAVAARLPPVPAGLARVWFLRQYEPGESLQTPMIYVDGQAIASSVPGTAFYRDFTPGTYTFSVETCTRDFNQSATLNLVPGSITDLEVQSLRSMQSYGCLIAMNYYVRQIPPRWFQLYSPQLTFLGPR